MDGLTEFALVFAATFSAVSALRWLDRMDPLGPHYGRGVAEEMSRRITERAFAGGAASGADRGAGGEPWGLGSSPARAAPGADSLTWLGGEAESAGEGAELAAIAAEEGGHPSQQEPF